MPRNESNNSCLATMFKGLETLCGENARTGSTLRWKSAGQAPAEQVAEKVHRARLCPQRQVFLGPVWRTAAHSDAFSS